MTPTNCPHCGMGWDEKMGEFECSSYPAGSSVVRSTACVEISRLRAELDAIRAGVAVVVPEPLDVEVEVELSKWWPVGPGWRAGFAEGVIWARSRAHSVPASRVLKDGERAVDAKVLERSLDDVQCLLNCVRMNHWTGAVVDDVATALDALRSQEG